MFSFRVHSVKELIDFMRGDSVYVVDVIHFEEMWTSVDLYSLVRYCVYNYHLF